LDEEKPKHAGLKLDEEKSKHAGLAHHKSFGRAVLHNLLRLAKGATHNLLRLAKGATHSKALHLPEKSVANIM
jgi:hypothetical protein